MPTLAPADGSHRKDPARSPAGPARSAPRSSAPSWRSHDVASIRVFSRDELKQSELERTLARPAPALLLGDVRDRDRLRVATRGVDVIVHAAALKQVPACEYNPFEAVQTNVIGAAERHLGRDRQRACR